MSFLAAHEKFEKSEEFQKYSKENPESYLAHGFYANDVLTMGYYNPDRDTISSFENGKYIGEEEIFKKEGKVEQLSLDKIKIDREEAEKIVDKEIKEPVLKKLFIIQNVNLDDVKGTVWNITYVTATFKTLNMKIDAFSGKVLYSKLTPIIDYCKSDIREE